MKNFAKTVRIFAIFSTLYKFTCAGFTEYSHYGKPPYVVDPSAPGFSPFSGPFPPQYSQGPFEEPYGNAFQSGPPSGPFPFYGQPSFGPQPYDPTLQPYQHQQQFPVHSHYAPQSQFQQSPPGRVQPHYPLPPTQTQYQRPLGPSQYGAPSQTPPPQQPQQLLPSGSPPSSYNGYFYQVNQGYNPPDNHNSLSQSPFALSQDGSHLPITYGEQFQHHQLQQQYQQNPQAQQYGYQVQPSVAPSTYNAPLDAPQNYQQQSYQPPTAPVGVNNYQGGVFQDTYANPSFANSQNNGDFSLSAPSNTEVVIDKSQLEKKSQVSGKKTEADVDKEDKTLAETKTRKTKPGIVPAPSRPTFKTIPPTVSAERVKTNKPNSYAVTIPSPTQVTKPAVFGQRIARGRSRNPFRNPQFEPDVTEENPAKAAAASNNVAK